MSTAAPARRPAFKPIDMSEPFVDDLTVAFHAALAEYRREFWSPSLWMKSLKLR